MIPAWYIGAALLGVAIGLAIGAIFRLVVPAGTNRRYWNSVGQSVRVLIFGDESDFWSNYRNVILSTARYVVRQLFALLAAFAPVAILLTLIAPAILTFWNEGADWAVYPEGTGSVRQEDGGESSTRILILDGGSHVDIPDRTGSFAICQVPGLACVALQSIGFSTTVNPEVSGETGNLVIARATRNDWNPLWPYLNDPEFLFFATLSVVSLYAMFGRSRGKSTHDSVHGVGAFDFALTDIAASRADLLHRIGNFESRVYSGRLAARKLERPVFISGLARSGTTILLEKLATLDGVATHRYRDAPFVMAPVFWHRLVTVFGRRQAPIERPHKDRIRITRESPEAFEEPIWQYFFGRSLEPVCADDIDPLLDARFRDFYRQHIRKILYLRKGSRYVSKGNYNILRMQYLLDIFPDAVFLLPVRHPIEHARSLVRQHEQFSRYAESDPRVAEYLEAVGHYEFGPQRLPLRFSRNGADKALSFWQSGEDLAGYAQQWSDVYGAIHRQIASNGDLSRHIRLVYFEELCANPEDEFASILEFAGLTSPGAAHRLSHGINPPAYSDDLGPELVSSVWNLVADVAARFGYRRESTIPGKRL